MDGNATATIPLGQALHNPIQSAISTYSHRGANVDNRPHRLYILTPLLKQCVHEMAKKITIDENKLKKIHNYSI